MNISSTQSMAHMIKGTNTQVSNAEVIPTQEKVGENESTMGVGGGNDQTPPDKKPNE